MWAGYSGSKGTGLVSPSCLCRWRTSVGRTNSATIGSGSRTRCSRNLLHMCSSRRLMPASPPVRPSGSLSVVPAVLQWTAAGPYGMAGGISSVDCSACFHGDAMGAGIDFICGNGPLTDDRFLRPIFRCVGEGVFLNCFIQGGGRVRPRSVVSRCRVRSLQPLLGREASFVRKWSF